MPSCCLSDCRCNTCAAKGKKSNTPQLVCDAHPDRPAPQTSLINTGLRRFAVTPSPLSFLLALQAHPRPPSIRRARKSLGSVPYAVAAQCDKPSASTKSSQLIAAPAAILPEKVSPAAPAIHRCLVYRTCSLATAPRVDGAPEYGRRSMRCARDIDRPG